MQGGYYNAILRLLLVAFGLVSVPSATAMVFNEIYYDAIGSDDNQEWFEIVNEKNETVDINGWKFFEDSVNHNLVLVIGSSVLNPGTFALVAEDAQTFLTNNQNFSGTLFDSSFSLSNTGETIVLKNNTGGVEDNITYSYIWGGQENGFSVGLYNGVWKETLQTPGAANKVSNICDWSVSILSDKLIFENSNEFSWKVKTERHLGEPSLLTIKRSIDDLYGTIVKSYDDLIHNITNKETLSYDPNLKPGTYYLKAEIIPACNDSNSGNNIAQQLLAVKGAREKDSSLEINTIYDLGKDKEAAFGQLIRVKVTAYKGDTTKNVVSLWIEGKEKVSKIFKFDINEKFTLQELTVPIQIFPNCKNNLKNGSYEVILEGLGEKDSKRIEIAGNAKDTCVKEVIKEDKQQTKKAANKKTETATAKEPKGTAESKHTFNAGKPFAISTIIFESSQRKAEKFVPYMFTVLASVMTLFLVFSKGIA